MLKKIVLVALFVVSAAVAATGTVFAHSAHEGPGTDGTAGVLCTDSDAWLLTLSWPEAPRWLTGDRGASKPLSARPERG